MTIAERQKIMKQLGYYQGDIDGIDGFETRRATVAFKMANGLDPRPIVGPVAVTLLRSLAERVTAAMENDGGFAKTG